MAKSSDDLGPPFASARNGVRVAQRVTVDETGVKLAADAVNALAKGVAEMRRYAKDKLIVLMLNDETGISKRDCQRILDAIPELSARYLKAQK